ITAKEDCRLTALTARMRQVFIARLVVQAFRIDIVSFRMTNPTFLRQNNGNWLTWY
ncbi:hypothetical protein D047_2738B, partial [Vibrio parahaemolyticus VPTS-2010_2]